MTEVETRVQNTRFLCVCADAGRRAWLTRALGTLGQIEHVPFDPVALVPKIVALGTSLVFIDFGRAPLEAPQASAESATAMAAAVRD
ncbi:hypothetical protein ACRXB1_35185, partial [Caballeronia sp. M23-90]